MFGKSKKTKEEKGSSEKKKIEWNPSDGLDWRDFLGIFILLGIFIWRLIRLIFAPAFWIYGENIRMIRFARTKDFERTLEEDERWFVETVPALYTLTGLIGGIIVGIFAALQFQENIVAFFNSLSLNFVTTILDGIGQVLYWLVEGIVTVIVGIGEGLSWLVTNVIALFSINPFLALGGLLLVGFVVVIIFVLVTETGFFTEVKEVGRSFLYWLVGSPDRFRLRVNSIYRRINHKLTLFLVGKERLHTRTQIYFKRVVGYSFFLSVWSLISGIFIGVDYSVAYDGKWIRVVYIAVVLLFAGVISGTIFFAFVARFLDLINRKKYISPEFINDEIVDGDAMKKYIDANEEKISATFLVPEEITENVGREQKVEEIEEEAPATKSKSKAKATKKEE